MIVYIMSWREYEQGFGNRGDGYSVHPSIKAFEKFKKEYWAKMPDDTPTTYSQEDWLKPKKIEISDEKMIAIIKEEGKLWTWEGTEQTKMITEILKEMDIQR